MKFGHCARLEWMVKMPDMKSKKFEQWEVLPYEGLGPLRLASSREANRSAFAPYRAIDRFEGLERRDGYLDMAVFVNYGQDDLAEFVEVSSPARPVFQNIKFIGRRIDDVLDDMESLGYEGRWNNLDTAVLFDEIGLLVGVSPSDKVDGVAVYKQGYWSQERAEEARRQIEEAFPEGSAIDALPDKFKKYLK